MKLEGKLGTGMFQFLTAEWLLIVKSGTTVFEHLTKKFKKVKMSLKDPYCLTFSKDY